MPASTAFVTDSNRPQPLRQPPPTACLTAPGAASEALSLLMHPCGGGGGGGSCSECRKGPRPPSVWGMISPARCFTGRISATSLDHRTRRRVDSPSAGTGSRGPPTGEGGLGHPRRPPGSTYAVPCTTAAAAWPPGSQAPCSRRPRSCGWSAPSPTPSDSGTPCTPRRRPRKRWRG